MPSLTRTTDRPFLFEKGVEITPPFSSLWKYSKPYVCIIVLMSKTVYLLNAFSLQMLSAPATVRFVEVDALPNGLISAIGHQDTASVLGVPMNRISVSLEPGDVAYVAQLQGGRLPEGSTTLPEGFKFKFFKVEVLSDSDILSLLRKAYDCGQGDAGCYYAGEETAKSLWEDGQAGA